ncbi:heterokaryon incompatibility protein-domain-containing protein [Phyllosticta capitalensis]
MPDLFQHKPLEQPDKQIRLFFLEKHPEPTSCDPSSSKSPTTTEQKRCISGRVQDFSLEDHPEYVALSYTWGDAKDTGQIVVNGALFTVTANLLAVLEVLVGLKELRGRPLWIDAICINQNDKDEKNSQVPLMGCIYSRATEVFAWIGPESDGSADMLGALDEFGDWWLKLREQLGDDRQRLGEAWAHKMINNDVDALLTVMDPSFQGPTSQTLKLFERPWWHRVWVIQEVTLARAASIMCGTCFFSWKNIMGTVHFLRDFQLGTWTFGPWSVMKALYAPIEHFFVLWDMCGREQLSAQAELHESPGDSRRLSEAFRVPELSLEEILEYLISLERDTFQASDERDRVYAFFAFLSPKDRALLDVDYSENTNFSDVMTTITQVMFQRHGPRILPLRQSLSPESQGLPSWYIDWTRIQRELAMYDPTYPSEFAAANRVFWCPQTCQTRGYPTQLPLDGIQISSVGKLALFDIDVSLNKNPRKTEAENKAEIKSLSCWFEMMLGLLKSFPDNSPSHGACKSALNANLCLATTAGDQIYRWTGPDNEVYESVPETGGGLERRLQVTYRPFEAKYWRVTGPEITDLFIGDDSKKREGFRLRWSLYNRFEVLMGERVPEEVVESNDELFARVENARRSAGHNPGKRILSSATESATNTFVWEYWRRIRLNGHKGFVTSDGRAGLGPRAMKTDDLVVIFRGCEFPFVIRPRCEEQKEYELVGACYVDGIMMGEAMWAMEGNSDFERMFLV